jgi:GTPase
MSSEQSKSNRPKSVGQAGATGKSQPKATSPRDKAKAPAKEPSRPKGNPESGKGDSKASPNANPKPGPQSAPQDNAALALGESHQQEPPVTHAGAVAIVGRPNVGKSTLVNKLVGAKVVITSRKAQTTRHRIRGILTQDGTQYVFVDTPGIQFKHTSALTRSMNRAAEGAMAEVDCVVFVCEANAWLPEDQKALDRVPKDIPVIAAINKVDRLKDKAKFREYLLALNQLRDFAAVVPISAQNGTQLNGLLKEMRKHMPEQPAIYDVDALTDRSERFIAAEFIREKLFRLLGDELPYQTAVDIDKFEEVGSLRRIYASIFVEKENQKAIVIGVGGKSLLAIGSQARRDMENLFGGKVYLELWVKVRSGWAESETQLRSLGME